MKYLFTIVAALLSALSVSANMPDGYFAKRSVLADGHWVKISVDDTGLYEISYETLRNMGFSNPQRVGVYGRGGAMLPENFTSLTGTALVSDDLSQISVLHYGNKLYFYAQGPRTYGFKSSSAYATKGTFYRLTNNVYSTKGYYFLSDKVAPKTMTTKLPGSTASLTALTNGVSYVGHEIDLVQNSTETGQLFFGEKIDIDNPRMEWNVTLPGAISGQDGGLECYYYADRDVEGTLRWGVRNCAMIETELTTPTTTNFRAQDPTELHTSVPGENATVFVELDTDEDMEVAHLDYWTLTYLRNIPTLKDSKGNRLNQEHIAFPSLTRGKSQKIIFPDASSMKVLDVSEVANPAVLDFTIKGSQGTVKVTNNGSIPQLVVFDPLMPQKQIGGYENDYTVIANQNIHEKINEGAELVIIHVPYLKEQAERLADIHRRYEGIKVVTASVDEVYNEFSQGVADAMAYRLLVKMAYQSPAPAKNVLLLGPISADYRGILNEKNPVESLIAYQQSPTNQVRGAQNANDFYGMMDNYLKESALEKNPQQVGVGILPCRFPAEAETIIDKIEEYLSRTDFAYYLNRMMNIGGVGDNHSHDKQANSMGIIINNQDNRSTIITPLIVDAYGYDAANAKLYSGFEDGSLMVTYFGHGNPYLLNHEGNFFRINDVFKFRNQFPPFMNFAGCELSVSDRGVRGLGEALLTSTPFGVIGTLLATRETWSGQNMEFFRSLAINIFRDGNTDTAPRHSRPLTIGEIVARTKSYSTYNNELAYQLMCDPALVLPVAVRSVATDEESYDLNVGEYNVISGYVCDENGDPDANFNGEIVIRTMEPSKELRSQDICSANDPENTSTIDIIYADTQTAMTKADVVNGKFSAKIFIPSVTKQFDGQSGRMHFAAYSPTQRLSAGVMVPVVYTASSTSSSAEKDDVDPVIERFEYSEAENSIDIRVTDNLALNFSATSLQSPFVLQIDGKEAAIAARQEGYIDNDGATMSKTIPLNDIAIGTHTAKLTVMDAAGNKATKEIVFLYDPARTRFAIELVEGAVNGVGTFRSVGTSPSSASLIILDNTGSIVFRDTFKDGSFEWNACDNEGRPVAPGLYKAYLLETGPYQDKGHSATIDVPVI